MMRIQGVRPEARLNRGENAAERMCAIVVALKLTPTDK